MRREEDFEPKIYRRGVEAARHALAQGVRITTIVVRRELACAIPGMRGELQSPADEEYVVRLALEGDVVFCPQRLCTYRYHAGQYSLSTWLNPVFLEEYRRVHEEALRTLGAEATEADRKAVYGRVAHIACTVARARAMAGRPADAAAALAEALRLDPETRDTAAYKRAKLLAESPWARRAYQWIYG